MEDIIGNGYAEKCKIEGTDCRCWYLPHHGVYQPQKPGKIRVVFDCSAQYANMSINTKLVSGTDLANQIVGVLLRFRKEHVAFMADIKSVLLSFGTSTPKKSSVLSVVGRKQPFKESC